MAEKDEQTIAREPWQRLLQDGADAPPDTTDARIRAAARRPFAKRPARWWLPASLAASFVLAFMLVQSQLGEKPAPGLVSESDVAAPESVVTRRAPENDETAEAYTLPERQEQRASNEEAPDEAPPPPSRVTDRRFAPRAEAPSTAVSAAPPSPSPSPPMTLPEAGRSAKRESAADEADEAEEAARADVLDDVTQAVSPQIEVTGARAAHGEASELQQKRRTPESWYAEIVALRAEGRTEEAERELERLEEAHPGWLKQHLAEQERNQDGR